MSSLLPWAVNLLLLLVLAKREQMFQEERTRWMRMLCSREQIPLTAMAPSDPQPETPTQPKVKKRLSFPVPGAAMWRPSVQSNRQPK